MESQPSGTADCRSPGLEQVGLTEGRSVLSPRGAGTEGEDPRDASQKYTLQILRCTCISAGLHFYLSIAFTRKGKTKRNGK